MIIIDGSMGEGGGQVLRTSLGLAALTGQPFQIENIRAGRRKPGLMRQHLTAVRAAAKICSASVKGDAIGSQQLTFEPGPVKPGDYTFSVGTAGSATLVFQTVLPALMCAGAPSKLTLEGGTHNPWAPPYDFLERALLPLLQKMGPNVKMKLLRAGFYPAGGGKFTVDIQPAEKLIPLNLNQRGKTIRQGARAVVSRLPEQIARRELKVIQKKLGWNPDRLNVVTINNSPGPGNIVFLEIESEHVTEVFTGFGEMHVKAEVVAGGAVRKVRNYLRTGVPVGPYLADQLLIPIALAGGRFRTLKPTEHTFTNIEVIQKFLHVTIACTEQPDNVWLIEATR